MLCNNYLRISLLYVCRDYAMIMPKDRRKSAKSVGRVKKPAGMRRGKPKSPQKAEESRKRNKCAGLLKRVRKWMVN